MRPSMQTSYRRYGKFLSRARLIRIPGHLVLQTVDLPLYLTYGIRIGISHLNPGILSAYVNVKLSSWGRSHPES
jgi:hypothetical protein